MIGTKEILQMINEIAERYSRDIKERLAKGQTVSQIASDLNMTEENVKNFIEPTLQELEVRMATSKLVIFMVIGDEGPLLLCGNDFTIDLVRTRWGEESKFYAIGAASIGMKEGIIGRFSQVTPETFEGTPEV